MRERTVISTAWVAELTKQSTVPAKVAETIGLQVAAAKRWSLMGVDPTPAPVADVSIGAVIETYTGSKFGSSATMTAALIISTAVKAVPVKSDSHLPPHGEAHS